MWCGALLALLGAMTSCEKALKNAPASLAEIQKPSSELAVIQVDSVRVDSTWKFHDPDLSEYGDCPPSFSCVMDVPSFDQAPILANAVMEWVNEECLRGTYSGDVTQVKQMLEAVMRSELRSARAMVSVSVGICSDWLPICRLAFEVGWRRILRRRTRLPWPTSFSWTRCIPLTICHVPLLSLGLKLMAYNCCIRAMR